MFLHVCEFHVGCALADIGEALKQMAVARDSLDISVKNNFIDPLQALQDRELREIGVRLISITQNSPND